VARSLKTVLDTIEKSPESRISGWDYFENPECYAYGLLQSVPQAFDKLKYRDLGWNFWILGQSVLASPYEFAGNLASSFALTIPFVEDFSYTDRTDRPYEIPAADWENRSKYWNYIAVEKVQRLDFVSVSASSMFEFLLNTYRRCNYKDLVENRFEASYLLEHSPILCKPMFRDDH
jgi:hypothetical protein